ncbi:MAG: hypothetical protein YK1312THETA_20001 [Marine Group I thaumarchaeote]|nr:MAG: hypothetical protein YK1312THETA_20001 [Marine Group I thaumarchaeote]
MSILQNRILTFAFDTLIVGSVLRSFTKKLEKMVINSFTVLNENRISI